MGCLVQPESCFRRSDYPLEKRGHALQREKHNKALDTQVFCVRDLHIVAEMPRPAGLSLTVVAPLGSSKPRGPRRGSRSNLKKLKTGFHVYARPQFYLAHRHPWVFLGCQSLDRTESGQSGTRTLADLKFPALFQYEIVCLRKGIHWPSC